MTTGFAETEANAILDARLVDYDYVQLHTGDPGAAGTANVAGNDTRKAISWDPASGGEAVNAADVDWTETEVDTQETYTHVSFHTAATGGTFKMSGTLTANQVEASGDAVRIAAGAYTIDLNVAA